MEPELAAILVSLAACTAGIAALALALGLSRLQAAVWALLATVGLAAGVASGLYAVLFECLESGDEALSAWPWSPRREFCDEESSPAQLGLYALLALPPLGAALGVLLWSRGRRSAAVVAAIALAGVVLPPWLYIESLPYYPRETTPVLHNPYLRAATESRPARACYAYGIVEGVQAHRPTLDEERRCVDLERSPASVALTGEYDEGNTPFSLEALGYAMSEHGLEPGVAAEGLVVARAYRLPGAEARKDSVLIPTYRIGP